MNERLRSIVKLAAERSEITSVKSWLHDDPHGKWEQRAGELLNDAQGHPAFPSMSTEAVNGEIATVIGLLAVETTLRVQSSH